MQDREAQPRRWQRFESGPWGTCPKRSVYDIVDITITQRYSKADSIDTPPTTSSIRNGSLRLCPRRDGGRNHSREVLFYRSEYIGKQAKEGVRTDCTYDERRSVGHLVHFLRMNTRLMVQPIVRVRLYFIREIPSFVTISCIPLLGLTAPTLGDPNEKT